MKTVIEKIGKDKIIAIIRNDSQQKALKAALACIEGGIKIIEITLNTTGAFEVLSEINKTYPHVLLGCGTALDVEMTDRAIQTGVRFVISPHTDKNIIDFCHQNNVVACPGTSTPTEMMVAHSYGADIIKVFPITNLGGPSYIKNIRGPLPHLKLMPTGGVDINNIQQFINAGVYAVGLSNALIHREAVDSGNFDIIKRLAQEMIKKVIHS